MRTMNVSNLYMYIHVFARTFVRLYAHSYIYIHLRARARVIISVMREIKQIIINYYRG